MTEIRFYHLLTRGVDQALPEILQKAYGTGQRIIVRVKDAAEVARLNQHLWTWKADSFLPHGSAKEGHAADQPIWLTCENDNPNGATILLTTCGRLPEEAGNFSLCCDIFDGRDESQLVAARERWKKVKETGHTLAYWQQTEKGWEQKA